MRVFEARRWWPFGASLAVAVGGTLIGCGSVEPIAPHDSTTTDPTQLYMRLALDHPAAALSTVPGYATLQLTATPRDALGGAMVGLPAPTFRFEGDTTKARVTADGLVTALAATGGGSVSVIAELAVGPVRHADTVVIVVTNLASPPVLASLSIQPAATDSAIRSMAAPAYSQHGIAEGISQAVIFTYSGLIPPDGAGAVGAMQLTPRLAKPDGGAIVGLPVEYTSLNPEIAAVNRRSGVVQFVNTGQVRLVARTTAYGVAKADTASFVVTPPILATVAVKLDLAGTPVFFPSSVRIAPYGLVSFANRLDDSVDVTFDNPADVVEPPAAAVCDWYQVLSFVIGTGPFCGAGNVLLRPKSAPQPDFGTDGSETTIQVRQFPVAGIYTYRSVRTGATGRVVVSPDYQSYAHD